MATMVPVIELNWTGATGTFNSTGGNVSGRAFHVEFSRGRDVASQLTGHSEPGSCQIILNNQSGDYNSYNQSSPLYGSLLPGRQVRVIAGGTYSALHFGGVLEAIQIVATNLPTGTLLTIEARFNLDVNKNFNRIIDNQQNNTGAGAWILGVNAGGTMLFNLGGNLATGSIVITTGTYHHVAARYDGSNMSILIDGTLQPTFAAPGITLTNTSTFFVGDNVSFFTGSLDDVRVWATARSDAEIARDKDRDLTGTEANLRYYFDMNEGQGTVIQNRSTALHGTLSGSANWVNNPLWHGFITRIVPGPSVKGVDTVVIEAEGPLAYINQKDIIPPVLANLVTGSIISTLLDKTGWASSGSMSGSFRDLDQGQTTVVTFVHAQDKPLAIIRKVEETEGGFVRESNSGKIVFESRTRRGQSPYTTSQATFTDSPTGTLFYNEIQQEEPLAFVFNEMVTTIQTYGTGATGTLWKLTSTGVEVPPLGSRIFVASFPGPTAAVNQIGVFSWNTPTATADYNMFSDPAGTGTNLNSLVTVSTVDNVNQLELIITNTSTRLAYVTFLQARGIPLQRDDPLVIPARDGTSETTFGKRTSPIQGGYTPTVQEGVDWADWNVAVYGDPTPRFGITFLANRSDAHIDHAIRRDVSDRVTLVATGTTNNLGVTGDFFIERVEHKIDADRTHTVRYLISEAEQFSEMWVMNVSSLGINNRLHF